LHRWNNNTKLNVVNCDVRSLTIPSPFKGEGQG
jgi:hypothetical protein